MEVENIKRHMEALLFASGEPLSVGRISELLEIDKTTVRRIADLLVEDYESKGFHLIWLEDSLQFCTKREYASLIRTSMEQKRSQPLSQAALEVLSVIAYYQPVTKGYIEQVRGVDCSAVVNHLIGKGLVEEKGRLDVAGRPITYGTTPAFLRCFQIRSIKDLPNIAGNAEWEPEQSELEIHERGTV